MYACVMVAEVTDYYDSVKSNCRRNYPPVATSRHPICMFFIYLPGKYFPGRRASVSHSIQHFLMIRYICS